MNGISSTAAFFHSSADIPGGVTILFRKETNQAPICLSLLNLNELESQEDGLFSEGFAGTCLSPQEWKLFNSYTYPKRKREWLGGRLAAKLAYIALSGTAPLTDHLKTISILPRENGSPFISSSEISKGNIPSLSISHSGNYAVAMVADAPSCGIDIQKISDKTQRVADRFCTVDEVQLLQKHVPQLNSEERLTLLWATKEALKKSLLKDQPAIFQGVTLQSITIGNFFLLQLVFPGGGAQPANIVALRLEDYMLAYTVVEHNHA